MKKWIGRSTALPAPVLLIVLLISTAAIFGAGCSTFSSAKRETKQLYKEIGKAKGPFIKTLAVLPFDTSKQWLKTDLEDSFLNELKSTIEKKGGKIHVILPNSPDFPAQLKQLERQETGEFDNYALALAGQAAGVNMVLSGRFVDIRNIDRYRRILWFLKPRHMARVEAEISVYHTGTGAKLLEKTLYKEFKTKRSDSLADIAVPMKKMGAYVFKYVPWEGRITAVDGDRIVISSGESNNLKVGKHLDVFRAGDITTGRAERRYFIPGEKIGTVTLTAVYPDRSEAVPEEGGPFPLGSVVQLQ